MQQGTRLVNWEIIYTKQAQKDAQKLAAAGLKEKALRLLEILTIAPFQNHHLMKNWLAIWPVLIHGASTSNTA
jgi:hypothetical protein